MRSGALAESYVAEQLLAAGWSVLARNLRTAWAEIDLLAVSPARVLVAVEVKSRHPLSWAQGEEALRPLQRRRLARALTGVAALRCWRGALRVDLAAVEEVAGHVLGWELLPGVELFDEGVQR